MPFDVRATTVFSRSRTNIRGVFALLVGAVAAALVISTPMEGLGYTGHGALALLAFAVIIWASETIPLPVSSLIIILIQPILGIVSFSSALTGFGNPILFLLLGGFMIAEGVASSGLGDRVAYAIMSKLGGSSRILLLGLILLTGMLSAWISNLVAFAMVLPVVKHILSTVGENAGNPKSNFPKRLILGASFGSLAGGLATQIGTGPNLIATSYIGLSFAHWMIFGVPLAFVLMLLIWRILIVVFPDEDGEIQLKQSQSSSLNMQERKALFVLLAVVVLSITSPITRLDEYAVALIGSVFFFLSGSITWNGVQKNIDWGTVVFFGAALSLGNAMFSTGAASWVIGIVTHASGLFVSPLPVVLILILVTASLTQVLSNVGLAAILVPIVIKLAGNMNLPADTFVIPAAVACSLSFMFPMSDPTIAMAYGTGYVRGRDILKAGFYVTIASVAISLLVVSTALGFLV